MKRVALIGFAVMFGTLGWASLGRAESADGLRTRIERRTKGVPSISTDELAALQATTRVLLLDVRSAEEFAVSHLPGALLADTVEAQRAAIARVPAEVPVVLYCSVGWRSAVAIESLKLPARRLLNLRGSIFAWANEGRALTDGTHEVFVVHPFDRTWGQLLDTRFWPATWRSP